MDRLLDGLLRVGLLTILDLDQGLVLNNGIAAIRLVATQGIRLNFEDAKVKAEKDPRQSAIPRKKSLSEV